MWLQIVLAGMSGLAIVLAAVATRSGNIRAKTIEGATPSYEALDARMSRAEGTIDDLRDEVAQLERDRDEDRRFIRALIAERPPSLPLPRPVPAWLAAPVWHTAVTAPSPTTPDTP